MKTILTISLLLSVATLAGPAAAVQLFDFDAQAIVPQNVGETAAVYGRIVNGTAVDTPLPLDFANYEYTIVVTGLTLDVAGAASSFSNGVVTIYEDAATSSAWGDAASFEDGTVVLSGSLPVFQHTMLTATLGTGTGYVDWTGGSMLNLLAPADQTGWPFLTTISRSATQVEPGYTEKWDGKVEPTGDVVPTENASWSEVKALFR